MDKWDHRFVLLSKHVASWSKDPSTQVGAVIVDEHRCVVSLGFNGFPRGVDDSPELYADKPSKYARVVHAEANAILTANRSVRGCTIYSSLLTCSDCAKLVIQSGIKRVVSPKPNNDRWQASFDVALEMYKQAGVEVAFIDE